MKFCDLAKLTHHNYEKLVNAGEFVKMLVDAILDDVALENDSSNPLYKLKKSTLEAYYSGRLPISQKKASALTPRLDEAKFADFINTYSFDALNHMNDKLVEHRQYIKDNGVDLPEVRAWKWNDGKGVEV